MLRRRFLPFFALVALLPLTGSEPASASGDSIMLAAGDIALCGNDGDDATAALLDGLPGLIQTIGDNVQGTGDAGEFTNCFHPTWGRHKGRIKPAAGNHEYRSDTAANPYFDYFGATAGTRGKGWYSYDTNGWHVVVLNTNDASCGYVGCAAGSEQERWLRADLAASPARCTIAVWHHPRWSSGGTHGNHPHVQALWQAVHDAGVELVLTGHDHHYERFAPLDASGRPDAAHGVRQFIVGTGGTTLRPLGATTSGSEVRQAHTLGLLELTLGAGTYAWRFVPVAGKTFTDSGTGVCHDAPTGGGGSSTSANLLANPGFEEGKTGWGGYQASVVAVDGGASGLKSGRVSVSAGFDAYSVVTSSRPVTATTAGTVYTASAKLRSTTGKTVCFRLREWSGGAVIGSRETCTTPTAAWGSSGTLSYPAKGNGSIDVYAYQLGAVDGDSFDIDDVSLVAEGAASPSPSPPPPPPPAPPADTTPPETTVDSGPAASTTDRSATFTFSANEAGSTFECSLDGAAYTACTSPATYSGLAVGSHTFDVRARDAAGNVDPTPARHGWTVAAGSGNLIANGSFEGSLSGWTKYQATLTLADGGANGSQSVTVSSNGAGSGISIITKPNPVAATEAGRVYRGRAFVRSSTGKRLCLRMREWSGGAVIGSRESCVVPGAGWTAIPQAVYTAVGGGSLDLYVYQYPSVATDSFGLDDVELTVG